MKFLLPAQLCVLLALAYVIPGCGPASTAREIEGTWLPATAELAGNMFPDNVRATIKLMVEGDKYTVSVGKAVDQGTLRLNPSASPKELDIIGTDGPNKGRTIHAIYERDAETLRICYDLSGEGRPKEFKTREGTQLFLVTYKKADSGG
jgi:uncharacterized protein (TIGR03067 family)